MICIDEKKEPVLDCYVSGYARSSMSIHRYCSGAQSETLLNLVNSSMLSLDTNVGASILSSRAWLLTPKAVSHRDISEGLTHF